MMSSLSCWVCRYRELQQPQVSSHMAAIPIPDAQTDEAEAVVSALQKAVAQAIQVLTPVPSNRMCRKWESMILSKQMQNEK